MGEQKCFPVLYFRGFKLNNLNPIIHTTLSKLFQNWCGVMPASIKPLPQSGSDRLYFRLTNGDLSAIGAFNPILKENEAFIHFTEHFHKARLSVPDILGKDLSNNCYLLEDLGDITLYDFVSKHPGSPDEETIDLYKKTLRGLLDFQLKGHEGFNYKLCFPRDRFDAQAMKWDLNYFKYYFLKLAGIPFDEQLLEHDFDNFTGYLSEADGNYFMYRDFQSRNVMIKDGEPWFIDYQGGRMGALQYDLASVLYQAKAQLPQTVRDHLFDFYLQNLSEKRKIDKQEFISQFHAFLLIRILQVLGAYGYRGYYEKKVYFIQSIPFALENLKYLSTRVDYSKRFPELWKALTFMLEQLEVSPSALSEDKLNISINSFSYKKGLPHDPTSNGGGFIFDCRILPNPGRLEAYKKLTGRDEPVIEYLEQQQEIEPFIQEIFKLAHQGVANYQQRNFHHIMFSFGCTGGQHRSVYGAERLCAYLNCNYTNINIILNHREQNF
jgi:aminoglycoside/choline kinase family phosphotransferase